MSALLAVWRLLDPRQRRQLAGLQLLSVAMGLSTVGGITAVMPFFAALADPTAARHESLLRAALQRVPIADDSLLLLVLGAGFVAIVLVANMINLFGFLTINRFAFRVGETLFVRLFDEYMHRDYVFHTRNHSSVLTTRVLHDTPRVTSNILQQGLILVTNVVMILCVGASMLLVNPVAAVGTIVALGASYAVVYTLARGRLSRNGTVASRYDAARVATVTEGFAAIREITLLQARDYFVTRFARQCRSISLAMGNTVAIASSPRYILECITVSTLVGIALYVHGHAGAHGAWIAQLSFVGFAAYRLLPALQQSFGAIVSIRANHPALLAIQTDLERARRAAGEPRVAVSDDNWRGRPHREIRLCGVSFRYAPALPEALSGVSLAFPAGKVIGLTGPNGSGKSTLLDLVCGLLRPQGGYIEVDGIRLEQGNCAAWQSIIAYVPQQVILCDASLAENIAFGVPVAQIDRERLEAAVRLAHLTECVASLPNGYGEQLGERGCRLSGGQRQRVAIARAMYRGASLLILDEVTSSLDATAEREIVELLLALRSEKTILVSAHRTAALRHCDVLFELRNGKVVETGKGEGTPAKTAVVRQLV